MQDSARRYSLRGSYDSGRIRWKTDMEKGCLTSAFERRGWIKSTDSGEDWNVYWATVGTVKKIFNPDTGYRLTDRQILAHFPNHYELTRKDLMVKNIKRYAKELAKEGLSVPNFVPTTYMLPADYSLFVEEFRKRPSMTWIMKPTSKARGVGIFMVNKLSQLKKWANGKNFSNATENYVISRYIDNPLLIGGKKFDLRLYVLVTSFRPLRVYMYREGFCRFCGTRYSNEFSQMDDLFIHLTNVSIQTKGEDYNEKHGNKWSVRNFRLYLEGQFGQERASQVFADIERIVLLSLKSVQSVVINDKHCFECYGYDILIDDNLKAWLVEVNASPSLSATTHSDRVMKHKLITDIFNVMVPTDDHIDAKERAMDSANPASRIGQFELMYDEAGSGRTRGLRGDRDTDGGGLERNDQVELRGNAKWR